MANARATYADVEAALLYQAEESAMAGRLKEATQAIRALKLLVAVQADARVEKARADFSVAGFEGGAAGRRAEAERAAADAVLKVEPAVAAAGPDGAPIPVAEGLSTTGPVTFAEQVAGRPQS